MKFLDSKYFEGEKMFDQKFEPLQSTEAFIAALNEEEGIGATISELSDNLNLQRILVIDGHSVDRTVEVAKDRGAEILFQDRKGKGDALAKAVEKMNDNVEFVVITDADFTYPALHVPEMIRILQEYPEVGMVCGNRFAQRAGGKAFQGRFLFGNKLLAFAHNVLNGVDLQDPLTGLRVVRASILKNWVIKSKGFDIEVELNHQVSKQGFETVEVPIEYRERLGMKKLKMKHGLTILKRIVYESFV
jgi:glycosyltransferase involved in cell wall biosynthesis